MTILSDRASLPLQSEADASVKKLNVIPQAKHAQVPAVDYNMTNVLPDSVDAKQHTAPGNSWMTDKVELETKEGSAKLASRATNSDR